MYQWDKHIAYAVCMAESRGIADRVSPVNTDGTNDKGLMQINTVHVESGLISDQDRLDPYKNVQAAYSIYLGSGWSAWSAYNNGAYRDFL